jgi:hypothetical protein
MKSIVIIGHFITGAALATGCTSQVGGTAPVISGLVLDPSTVEAGATQSLQGTLSFEDPDADILEVQTWMLAPGQPAMAGPTSAVAGARGQQTGTVSLALIAAFPSAGEYEVEVRVRDAEGNDSNALRGQITVHDP